MKGAKRAWLGAAFGGLLTMLLYPVSRPMYWACFWQPRPPTESVEVPALSPGMRVPDPPKTLLDAAIWVHVASGRLNRGIPLSTGEYETLLAIVRTAKKREPENAFWWEMEAVYLWALRQPQESVKVWQRAAKCNRWNDMQSDLLESKTAELGDLFETRQAWQYARMYLGRSLSTTRIIREYAKRVLEIVYPTETETLNVRFNTLTNGYTMLRQSKSVDCEVLAAHLMDIVSQRPGLDFGESGAKRLLLARSDLIDQFREAKMVDRAQDVDKMYREADAVIALIDEKTSSTNFERLAVMSVVLSAAPSAFLVASLIGLVAIWVGSVLRHSHVARLWTESPRVYALAFMCAFVGWFITRQILSSLAPCLCVSFLAWHPERTRSRPREYFGLFFGFLMAVLGISFSICVAAYVLSKTPASVQILPTMGLPEEIIGWPGFLALGLLSVALIPLVSPIFAYVHRVEVPRVLSMGLRVFGGWAFGFSLAFSLISGPVCLYGDQNLQGQLKEILVNEPLHQFING